MPTYAQIHRPFGPIPRELPPVRSPWLERRRAFHRHFCCPDMEPGTALPEGLEVPDYPHRLDLLQPVLMRAGFWRMWTEYSHTYGRTYHAEVYDTALPECVARGPGRPVGAVGATLEWAVFDCLMLAAKLDP